MKIYNSPSKKEWESLCRRNIPADDPNVTRSVERIVAFVAQRGDAALREYALKFDGAILDDILMSEEDLNRLCEQVKPEVREAMQNAAKNIETFHKAQLMQPIEIETTPGVRCIQRQVPIHRVGLYIPGGRAPLFSTVLMLGIPAKIAQCPEIILCTPRSGEQSIAPEIAYAASLCGIKSIYQVGGAQAIAAMAYGTETISRVDKIFGPGNRYVTKAKQLVSTVTAIDMPAGPSEVMVMADDSANPEYIAADLLSQAEHGPDSQAILVTSSAEIAQATYDAVEKQKQKLLRVESVEKSLKSSRIIVLSNKAEMIEFANQYGAEHLIIQMNNPWVIADQIESAGSVFIGPYSPESAGDYASGTNHTLPTSGWAHAVSGVNIDSFMKKITYQQLTYDGLKSLSNTIITMAKAESLDAHANAVKVRLES